MRLTMKNIDTKYAMLFLHCKDVKSAKAEVLMLFSEYPDDEHEWSEQDIYEQIKKICIHRLARAICTDFQSQSVAF